MKAFLIMALVAFGVPSLWAASPGAVLQSLKGKVEVKAPGETHWTPATDGEALPLATTLSTGFDSSVVVAIGKTTIQVKPLTRMTIDMLVEEGGAVKTSTFLRVGNVSVAVKSADGVKQDFKVQSPFSTASVRGTEFDFDGLHLAVREGLVAFQSGRSPREFQPVPGQATPPDHSADFVGAPDVPASAAAVPVAAGSSVQLVVSYQGQESKTSSSNDLDSLQKSSGQNETTPTTTPSKTTNQGSVTLTIQFGS